MHLRSTSMMMALLLVVSASGCKSTRLSHDGNEVRGALLQLYEDQAMDNLIRARRDQPVVHLDFKQILVQETDSIAANYGTGQSSNKAIAGAARLVSASWNLGANASNRATVSYNADPLNNETGVYDLYRDFADQPGFLHEGYELPDWDVHIYREYEGCYYWISCDRSRDFYEFMMATTFDRRKDPIHYGHYDIVISEILHQEEGEDGQRIAIIKVNPSLPKGHASAFVKLEDGREVRLDLLPPDTKPLKDELRVEIRDERRRGVYSVKNAIWNESAEFTAGDLTGRAARVYSADNPPQVPATRVEELLEKSALSLERLRANQN